MDGRSAAWFGKLRLLLEDKGIRKMLIGSSYVKSEDGIEEGAPNMGEHH